MTGRDTGPRLARASACIAARVSSVVVLGRNCCTSERRVGTLSCGSFRPSCVSASFRHLLRSFSFRLLILYFDCQDPHMYAHLSFYLHLFSFDFDNDIIASSAFPPHLLSSPSSGHGHIAERAFSLRNCVACDYFSVCTSICH